MLGFECEGRALLETVLFSFPKRRELGELVLATYRVELTRALNRIASDGASEADLDEVHSLARDVGAVALAARLEEVRSAAFDLELRAAAPDASEDPGEGAMLIAGLRLVERILESASAHRVGSVN